MTAFDQAKTVEARSLVLLMPFLREQAHNGQLVLTSKGTLATYLQEIVGDLLFNASDERLFSVELKAENKFTGNLFLETWSNRNLVERRSHASRGSNPGWLCKTRADLLFYHFLDSDRLYVFDMFKLKRWAFAAPSVHMAADRSGQHRPLTGRMFDFVEVAQSRYEQLNDTRGRLVPVKILEREVGCRLLHPAQLSLNVGQNLSVA